MLKFNIIIQLFQEVWYNITMTAARTLANLTAFNPSLLANVDITSTGSSNTPLIVDAASGQSADIAQFRNSSGSVISRVNSSGQFVSPGNIVQLVNVRSDALVSYSFSTGNGTEISALNMTITPKYANSKLLMQWELGYESNYNGSIVIWKNGSILSNGYNTVVGNQSYSGYATTAYDGGDVASTPNRTTITFIDSPGVTTATTYSLAVRSHEASTFKLNQAFSNAGANAYENQVSLGYIMEIAQ
jgi:hypothetical protein